MIALREILLFLLLAFGVVPWMAISGIIAILLLGAGAHSVNAETAFSIMVVSIYGCVLLLVGVLKKIRSALYAGLKVSIVFTIDIVAGLL